MADKLSNERMADLLTAYGSDLSRWPAEQRARLEALEAATREGMIAEYRAFDQLIANAKRDAEQTSPSDDLMARIVAALPDKTTAVSATPELTVVPLSRPTTARRDEPVVTRREWTAAAALMAASLVLGIFIGTSEQVQSTAARMSDMAGLSIVAQPVQTSALDEPLQPQDDEDIL